ncbi:MAG: EscU/YscU/HrcU family type III secretion system export apparatus switch protein [Spirochaetota bacterium]
MSRTKKKAVALRYDSGSDDAPVILKKARESLVDTMRKIAEKHNITVYRDVDLTEALYAIPEGSQISPDLYKAVAEVIAYCYTVNSDTGESV